jgi:hypothetical protein
MIIVEEDQIRIVPSTAEGVNAIHDDLLIVGVHTPTQRVYRNLETGQETYSSWGRRGDGNGWASYPFVRDEVIAEPVPCNITIPPNWMLSEMEDLVNRAYRNTSKRARGFDAVAKTTSQKRAPDWLDLDGDNIQFEIIIKNVRANVV